MHYTMTKPCPECPFLKSMNGYTSHRLAELASGEFACHKSAEVSEDTGNYEATKDSVHCAGALIYLERRNRPHQMMRICERLGRYDRSKLDMSAPVR